MSVKREMVRRYMYHKDRIRECEENAQKVWDEYTVETRKGLDEDQLKDLLIWRKVELAKLLSARTCHEEERDWLAEQIQNA
jgi:hypothetical protein